MRTGIRSGIAPSDVWHLHWTRGDMLCGRKRVRASLSVHQPNADHQIESQGGSLCEKCRAVRLGGATPKADVHDGDVVRYHPILSRAEYVRVRVDGEPYELGDGSKIVKANGVDDGQRYHPSVGALSEET